MLNYQLDRHDRRAKANVELVKEAIEGSAKQLPSGVVKKGRHLVTRRTEDTLENYDGLIKLPKTLQDVDIFEETGEPETRPSVWDSVKDGPFTSLYRHYIEMVEKRELEAGNQPEVSVRGNNKKSLLNKEARMFLLMAESCHMIASHRENTQQRLEKQKH